MAQTEEPMPVVCTLPTQPPRRTPPLSLLLLFRLWIITSQPLRRDPHCEIERTRAEAHPVSICELRIDALLNPAGVDICEGDVLKLVPLSVVRAREIRRREQHGALGRALHPHLRRAAAAAAVAATARARRRRQTGPCGWSPFQRMRHARQSQQRRKSSAPGHHGIGGLLSSRQNQKLVKHEKSV